MKKERVLITGISGFVGSHLAEYLLAEGLEVYGMIRWRSKLDNIKVECDPDRMRPSDVQILLCDCAKFRERTGWNPAISFKQTLSDLLDYWRGLV